MTGRVPAMRATLAVSLAALVALAGWIIAGPYLVTGDIRDGLRAGDAQLLARHVDFEAVRADLKQQLKASIVRQAQADRADNPYASLAQDIALSLVDRMVDAIVTPQGLARLARGSARATGDEAAEPFAGARYDWEALDRFAIRVPAAQDNEVVFVLTRDGLVWRMTGIRLPVTR